MCYRKELQTCWSMAGNGRRQDRWNGQQNSQCSARQRTTITRKRVLRSSSNDTFMNVWTLSKLHILCSYMSVITYNVMYNLYTDEAVIFVLLWLSVRNSWWLHNQQKIVLHSAILALLHVRHSSSRHEPNCGVEHRAPPILGRATITLGIGPHSSITLVFKYFCI